MNSESGGQILSKLRYHVFVCCDAGNFCGCESKGSAELIGALRRSFVKTTLMNCNQPDARGPVLVVYPEGNWYEGLTVDDVEEFIDTQLIEGLPFERCVMAEAPRSGYSAY